MKSEENHGASQIEEPVLKSLLRDKEGNHFMPFERQVPILHGQPCIIQNYPPQKLGGEVVANFAEMPHKQNGDVQISEALFTALRVTEPVLSRKPDELFGTGLTCRETLPFQSPDIEKSDAGNPNIITETERRKAIAESFARIIIRTQHEESNDEFKN